MWERLVLILPECGASGERTLYGVFVDLVKHTLAIARFRHPTGLEHLAQVLGGEALAFPKRGLKVACTSRAEGVEMRQNPLDCFTEKEA